VLEEQSAGGATLATYVYGRDLDEVLNMRRGGMDYFYHGDAAGSVMAVTDTSGDVVERYEYLDYGQPQVMDAGGGLLPASAIGNPYLFTGRRYDLESSLYYNRTRYMDPHAGRFTSRDSIGIWGDEANLGNGYTYAASNPGTFVDPSGQTIICAGLSGYVGAFLAGSASIMLCTDDCKQPPDEALVTCLGGGFGGGAGVGVAEGIGTGCLSLGFSSQLTLQGGVGPVGGQVSIGEGDNVFVAGGGGPGEGPIKLRKKLDVGGAATLEGCHTLEW
jgi:RHS repeat-associated protein